MDDLKKLLDSNSTDDVSKQQRLPFDPNYAPNTIADAHHLSTESLNFSDLPDEYFEQFHSGCEPPSAEKPEVSLSVQMFFVPESDDEDDKVVIHLKDFLGDSGTEPLGEDSAYTKLPSTDYINSRFNSPTIDYASPPINVPFLDYHPVRSSVTTYGEYLKHTSIEPKLDQGVFAETSECQPISSDYLVHTSISEPYSNSGDNRRGSSTDLRERVSSSSSLKNYEESSSGDSGYISPADVIRARELERIASFPDLET